MRILNFEQITDSRFYPIDDCLLILNERIEKIKTLLNIEGIILDISNPYLIDWTQTMRDHNMKEAEKNPSMSDYYLKEAKKTHIQYRAGFRISKNTRKTTWNDIYKIVNSVKAVPYSFI